MRSQLISKRLRSSSLTTIPPRQSSDDYSVRLADLAGRILYLSPLPSQNDLQVYILNSAALPDIGSVDYDSLLPYVLARLPDEDELIGGKGYEVVFFAGGDENGPASAKKGRPGWGWFLQAYHILSRAMRKRLRMLYIVHERIWTRVLMEMFSTIMSPKFRRKIVHGMSPAMGEKIMNMLTFLLVGLVSTLSALALRIPIENLLIPPSAYICDRRVSSDIHAPYATGKRAFGARIPLPISASGSVRLPRVLRETSSFLLDDQILTMEGLFRVNARAVTLEILKEAYDRGQKFIVWKEADTVLTFAHRREGYGDVTVGELDLAEGYGAYCAAGLIKLWYASLREPIFPQSSYVYLERVSGNPDKPIETTTLLDLIGESSDWSAITKSSRQILTRHLIPLLAAVEGCEDRNRMTAENLAACFAASLIYGPDPVEDCRILTSVRRILTAAITLWNQGLSTACGTTNGDFAESLRLPEAVDDREDALESIASMSPTTRETQLEGITLIDNDDDDGNGLDDTQLSRPPLPPRLNLAAVMGETTVPGAACLKRKPAPAFHAPPRYSSIVTQSPGGMDALPAYERSMDEGQLVGKDDRDRDRDCGNGDGWRKGSPTTTAAGQAVVVRKPVPNAAAAAAADADADAGAGAGAGAGSTGK